MTFGEISRSKERSTQIMTRLKEETKEYHSKLESLPYFKALIDHRLPLECYVNQLRAMAIIHSVLNMKSRFQKIGEFYPYTMTS